MVQLVLLQPEFWPTGLGGYDENGSWQSGFEPYATYFHRVALALNPCSVGKPHLVRPRLGQCQHTGSILVYTSDQSGQVLPVGVKHPLLPLHQQ